MPENETGSLAEETNNNFMSRRKAICAFGTAGLVSIAGCSGSNSQSSENSESNQDESSSGSRDFTAAGLSGENQEWDKVQPQGHDELIKRVESESDGEFTGEFIGESQICGEETCPETVQQGTVQIGYAGLGNSTNTLPQNDIFCIPYTFEENQHLTYTLSHDEVWSDYWVPFAKENGVLPVMFNMPHLKHVLIGRDTSDSSSEPFTAPADIEDLSMRRTESSVAGIVFDQWGANPENISWGDTAQGLQSGVVDGMETWLAAAFGFGMIEPTGEITVNSWGADTITAWADVEWLQSLSESELMALSEATRSITEDQTNRVYDIHREQHGLSADYEPLSEPLADSVVAEADHLDFNVLSDENLKQWRDPVEGMNNKQLYQDIFSRLDDIGLDGEAVYDMIHSIPRESGAPSSASEFSVDSWWIDHLSEI